MTEEEVTFSLYFRRYEDLYKTIFANRSDLKKVRVVLRKLGAVEHTKFVNYILRKNKKQKQKTNDITFKEAVI